ncbi:PAS domain-containing sensor histidine kinase [Paenibacillus mendelii]|uniref:histidine kinase n=1 Tax=Paenibacillus mendelii TaxID=206163 RepID=A0ABV6JJC2_9BACL|nr:PAS domain-containing sensor histidine kinase [Paenibacillus mendelii]MCQ6557817.1 PAS domain S-box protein [Paenibacillus mendelii]
MRCRVSYLNNKPVEKLKEKVLFSPHCLLTENINGLLENYLTGVYLVQDERVLYVNSRLAEMFGYTQEEMLSIHPVEFVHPEDRNRMLEETRKRLKGMKRTAQYWLRGVRKDGSIFYYETHASLITYGGKPALMGTVLDVTSQKHASELIVEHDLRYQRLIKYLPEPIIVHDKGEMIYINNAGLKLLGADSPEQILCLTNDQITHPDHHESMRERLAKVVLSDEPLDFMETVLIGLDGQTIEVEASSIRIHNFLGRKLVIQTVFRDIRDRKRAEEALINSEKLSVAGQMAAGIAHEIRNPLASLKGFSQLLKTKFDKHHDYLDIMLTELDRINGIVQEFMALAKPQAHEFYGNHDVAKIIKSVMTLLETQAVMNNVQINLSIISDSTVTRCDENQIKQVFINLLKNAIDAMPLGGEVDIDLALAPQRNDSLAITITDHGVGIPKEQLEKLGGPFYTTKSSGTGLGLMICNRIIAAHHGSISFTSELGTGTSVTVVLPVISKLN